LAKIIRHIRARPRNQIRSMVFIPDPKIVTFTLVDRARYLGTHEQSHQFGRYVLAKSGKKVGAILWAETQDLGSLNQTLALTFDPAKQIPRHWRIDVARMRRTRATQPMNGAEQFCSGRDMLRRFRTGLGCVLAHRLDFSIWNTQIRASSWE